jgi:hypothetical protein
MKAMQRDPQAPDKARRAERRLDEKGGAGLISIRPVRLDGGGVAAASPSAAPAPASTPTQTGRSGGGGFKKGGFKSAFGGGGGGGGGAEAPGAARGDVMEPADAEEEEQDVGFERYDPRRPTGCSGSCGVK